MASLILKGVLSFSITITRRLPPTCGTTGPQAKGGIAFASPVKPPRGDGADYMLVDDDGSRRGVTIRETSLDDSGAHGLAYYLDLSET